MARPLKEIDEARLAALASRFCTNEEIAADLGCSDDTLVNRFSEPLKKGRNNAKKSLRARQFEVAMGRPAQPAVYLRTHQDENGNQFGELVLKDGEPILILEAQEAVKPNVTMLIFLGKQYLDQSDKHTFEGAGDGFEFV